MFGDKHIFAILRLEEKALDRRCNVEEKEERDEEQVGNEYVVVAHPDAIVDPGTMVIPLLHAPVADVAVLRPWGCQHFTAWADVI